MFCGYRELFHWVRKWMEWDTLYRYMYQLKYYQIIMHQFLNIIYYYKITIIPGSMHSVADKHQGKLQTFLNCCCNLNFLKMYFKMIYIYKINILFSDHGLNPVVPILSSLLGLTLIVLIIFFVRHFKPKHNSQGMV